MILGHSSYRASHSQSRVISAWFTTPTTCSYWRCVHNPISHVHIYWCISGWRCVDYFGPCNCKCSQLLIAKFQSPRIGCFSRSILPPRRETTRRDRDALKREADELAQWERNNKYGGRCQCYYFVLPVGFTIIDLFLSSFLYRYTYRSRQMSIGRYRCYWWRMKWRRRRNGWIRGFRNRY